MLHEITKKWIPNLDVFSANLVRLLEADFSHCHLKCSQEHTAMKVVSSLVLLLAITAVAFATSASALE